MNFYGVTAYSQQNYQQNYKETTLLIFWNFVCE